MRAALIEFGQNSYDTASINRIIRQSGTSKGTFYHYFSDKKALYFGIIEDAIRVKQEYLTRMTEQLRSDDIFTVLKAQARAAGEMMREKPEMYQLGVRFAAEQGTIRAEVEKKYISQVGDAFKQIVSTWIAGGTFSKRYPPEFIVRIIWYMTMHYFDILFDQNDMPSATQIEQGLDMMFDFLKHGLS